MIVIAFWGWMTGLGCLLYGFHGAVLGFTVATWLYWMLGVIQALREM